MELFIFAITLAYLLFQSVSDIKTKKVYVSLNNAMIVLSVLLYLFDICNSGIPFFLEPIAVVFVVCLLCVFKLYGSGDAKAFIAIYFNLRYVSPTYPLPDLALLLISYLFSAIFLLIASIGKQTYRAIVKKEKFSLKNKREAFFPYLTAGYLLCCLLCAFAF